MELTVEWGKKTLINMEVEELLAAGVPVAVIGAAAKAYAAAQVAQMADGYRAHIATQAPGKIAEWLFKEQIATKANAFREIALLVGVIEAEAKEAIAAIPDDADDIETQIHNTLAAAKAQAETAFNEAITLINGGS